MSHRRSLLIITIITLMFSMVAPNHAAVSLGGTSGLINIPVAQVLEDRQVTIGLGMVNRHSAYIQKDISDNFPFYIVIGYLPRLEISVGATFVPGKKSYDGTNTYKDGVIGLQCLLVREKSFVPDLAIGVRDIYRYILLNTTYCVLSKTIAKYPSSSFRIHFGYGSDMIDEHIQVAESDKHRPVGHTIVGMFGGLEFNWRNFVTLMVEYDSDRFNSGLRMHVNRFLYVDIDALNMEDVSGSINFLFRL